MKSYDVWTLRKAHEKPSPQIPLGPGGAILPLCPPRKWWSLKPQHNLAYIEYTFIPEFQGSFNVACLKCGLVKLVGGGW